MAGKLTDDELRPVILRWIEVTQHLDEIGYQLGRIGEKYAELQYPDEIERLSELEPIDRRKQELALQEHDLQGRSCRLGNEQARLDEQIRATLRLRKIADYKSALRWGCGRLRITDPRNG